MKVYSDIYLNWLIRPLAENSRNKIRNPITVGSTTYLDGYLDYKCFMMLDVISTVIAHMFYKKGEKINLSDKLPSQNSKEVLNRIQKFSTLENTEYFGVVDNLRNIPKYVNEEMPIPLKKLKEIFPFLKDYKLDDIIGIFDKISKCKLSTRYKCTQVKNIVKEGELIKRERIVVDYDFSSITCGFFNYTVKDDVVSIKFRNPLGTLFAQNAISLNFHVINSGFYKLKEYPQNLYRFLTTIPGNRICIDVLSESMRLTDNKTHRNNNIEAWLDTLNSSSFLSNGRIVNKRFVEWDSITYPEKKDRRNRLDILEEKVDSILELLKALNETDVPLKKR